jgi:diguanylate cyclase (GGDEF)-like protein
MFQIELTRRMAAYVTERETFSVLVMRLDRLQVVTDSLGHNAGDLLIKKVSERMEQLLEPGDHISRIGSNEFAMLYTAPSRPEKEVEKLGYLYKQLTVPYEVYEEELYLQIRFGSARYPRDGSDMTSLLRNASNTRSVVEERDLTWFQPEQAAPSQEALNRLSLENDLRKALDRGEFEVFYQPQFDIISDRLVGVEALIRWRHATRGLVSPAEFIPAAEETGMIVPIGDWVLRTACMQWKSWSDAGYGELTVSVNLSLRQFQKHNMIGDVFKIVKETGMNPAYLEFEITESMAMDNMDRVIRKLNELRNLGIRIAMDDFGTGYSSLNYLKKIPIQKLKIDQSFIRDISSDSESAAIVSTIISMAKHLKLEVIAEGVETAEDLEFLQQKQCGQAQGYFFSRPLPVSELEAILQKHIPICL